MNRGRITRYVEERYRITAHAEAQALEPKPVHEGWTNFASQRSVRAIAVASGSGHMWLATWGGVLSWNRKQERLYRRYGSEHGLAGNAVSCLCLDQAERPWVGHEEGGLSYFDGQRFKPYAHLSSATIRVLCAAKGAGLWAAGADTVYRISGPDDPPTPVANGHDGAVEALALLPDGDGLLLGNAWGLFRLQPGQSPVPVLRETIGTCTALARGAEGEVWLGTPGGIYRMENEVPVGPMTSDGARLDDRVVALVAGRKRLWVLTTAGLAQVVDQQWRAVPGPETGEALPTVRAIAAGPDASYLWVGTDHLLAGVQSTGAEARWDLNLLPPHRDDELNNLGRCAASQATREQVWIGTADGLIAFDPEDPWTLHAKGTDVRALGLTPTEIWLLSWPYGVQQFTPNRFNRRLSQLPGLPTALAVGKTGDLHAVTGRALWYLGADEPPEISAGLPAPARHLVQTPDETWWLGTTRGVYRLVDGVWELAGEQPGPLQAGVYALAAIHDTLWAATEAGLWAWYENRWDLHADLYAMGRPESPHVVSALAPAGDASALWLARRDGVVRYDPTVRTTSAVYTPANSGLVSRRVTALLENSGFLWIVTRAGISRLAVRE
ncbi:MAG: hypothetical protein GY842_01925 [bacterium]|nr:hypothetical protein [bacterium]